MNRSKKNKKPSNQLPTWIKIQIEKIKNDNTSGAINLTKQVAKSYIYIVDNYKESSKYNLLELINQTSLELTISQPTIAPIFNLANKIMLDISKFKNEEKIKKIIHTNCKKYINRLNNSILLIMEKAANIIKNNSTIIVHSYSDTILKTLIYAKEINKKFNIICSESRPMNEGIILAKKLGEKGIKTNLIIDSAIFSFLPETDLIIVGTDSISKHGLVNKIGTFGLALAAKKLEIDFYTLCSIDKILPYNYQLKKENLKDPSEISKKSFKNVNIINYYFDLTPLNYLTGIITEEGIKSPNEIKQYIKNLRIHKNLINQYE